MSDDALGSTRTSRIIKASCKTLYQAFLDPAALVEWLPPGEMTGKIDRFDARAGGGYEMSLFYPASDRAHRGKSSEKEDRVNVRFVKLEPPMRIVEAVLFQSADPAFAGEMILEATFEPVERGTKVHHSVLKYPGGYPA